MKAILFVLLLIVLACFGRADEECKEEEDGKLSCLEGVSHEVVKKFFTNIETDEVSVSVHVKDGKITVTQPETESVSSEIEWHTNSDCELVDIIVDWKDGNETLRACLVSQEEHPQINVYTTIQEALEDCPFQAIIIDPREEPYRENLTIYSNTLWVGADKGEGENPKIIGLHTLMTGDRLAFESLTFIHPYSEE